MGYVTSAYRAARYSVIGGPLACASPPIEVVVDERGVKVPARVLIVTSPVEVDTAQIIRPGRPAIVVVAVPTVRPRIPEAGPP